MEKIRQTQKKYGSIVITLAILAGTVLMLAGLKPAGKGLILGALFSILNFVIMGETLPMKINHSRKKTLGLSLGSVFIRYGLMAIPLVLAIKMEQFHFAATVCGLFMVQIIILTDSIIRLVYHPTPQNTV